MTERRPPAALLGACAALAALLLFRPQYLAAADLTPPPYDSASNVARMNELEAAMSKIMDELPPLLKRLDSMKESYGEEKAVQESARAREALRSDIEQRLHALEQLEVEYDQHRRDADKMALIGFFTTLQSNHPRVDSNADLVAARNRTLFSSRSSSFRSRTSDALGGEEEAFRHSWNAYQGRRHRTLAAWLLPVLILLGAGIFFWQARRSETRLARPQTPAPAAPAGASPAFPAPIPGALAGPAPAPAAQAPLALPAVVARDYRLEESLGKDCFGFLYEGVEIPRSRRAFIRHLRPEIAQAGGDMELLLADARISAHLKHPGIVGIYSMAMDQDQAYMAFEPVRGKSLADFLAAGPNVPLGSAKRLLRPVAAALDYAHAHKVIHRDLKPANIWIAPAGGVKVADFGISHLARVAVAKRVRDENWGSDPYMAPEQDYGMPSKETDIFSLGVILYEMLAGRVPFVGPNFSAQKREMAFPSLLQAAPGLPPAAEGVVMRALAADSRKRYASAAEFADALDAL